MPNSYQIMHLDRLVATVTEDGLASVVAPSFLPYNLYLSEDADVAARVNNLGNFFYWCASRVLTLDRKYAKEILNAIGATQGTTDRERARISLSYHCVTLTDVYWVKNEDENLRYADINLYEHSLSDAFVDVSLLGKQLTAENAELLKPADTAGDVSTQGAVPKAWIRRGGEFYLLKDGGERDVHAEILASKIAQCFDIDQVVYESSEFQGVKVSCGKLATSLRYSIVPMEFVEIYAANHDTTREAMIRQYDPYGYHMMNTIDYLVGNTDRHWGNWGFLIDNETNLPIKLHPLMDFNKSFLAYDSIEGGRCLTTDNPMSQMDAALHAVASVGLNQRKEIKDAWFTDPSEHEMFFKRLALLSKATY